MSLILLLIIVSVVAYVNMTSMARSSEFISSAAEIKNSCTALARDFIRQQDGYTDYSLTREPEVKKEIAEDGELVRKDIEILKVLLAGKETGVSNDDILKIHEQFETTGEMMASLYIQGKQAEGNAAMEKFDGVISKIEKQMAKLEDFANRNSADAVKAAADSKRTANILIIGISLLSVMTALILGLFLSRSIAMPVIEVARIASRIAEGDIDQDVRIERDDEIGTLAASFREMITYLKAMANAAGNIAEGDLRSEVKPKSGKDVLGNAFVAIIERDTR